MHPYREDHEFEQGQASVVQRAKEELEALLGRVTNRKQAIEDAAKEAMEVTRCPEDREALEQARSRYIDALNELWLYAEDANITAKLRSGWMATNRKNLAGLSREDYGSEATFAMRQVCASYKPGGAPLAVYGWSKIRGALTDMRDAARAAEQGVTPGGLRD